MTGGDPSGARAVLAANSKSFALAGKLLPAACRDDAAVIYAWCRRADDAVDLGPPAGRAAALAELRRELDAVYAGRPAVAPDAPAATLLRAFAEVVRRRAIPRRYPSELLDGMEMDVRGDRYGKLSELLVYCYRVAGTVGVMMAHLMGVAAQSNGFALARAADLGMAMQLTNVCRDVAEDWQNGRLYLPRDLYTGPSSGALDGAAAGRAVAALLAQADQLYRSGDAGLPALRFRCAVAIRAARFIYSDIGRVIARRRFDVSAGRAVVSRGRKLWLVARAFFTEAAARLRAWGATVDQMPTAELKP